MSSPRPAGASGTPPHSGRRWCKTPPAGTSARSTPCASAGSEVVLEAGCPQHVGAEPAAVQREQRVGHQRDPRAGRELEAERAVDHVIALVGERSEEHTSELQSRLHLVCRLLLEKKKKTEHTRIQLR